jgi:hypothetical protein
MSSVVREWHTGSWAVAAGRDAGDTHRVLAHLARSCASCVVRPRTDRSVRSQARL